jgi:hypothetical protein
MPHNSKDAGWGRRRCAYDYLRSPGVGRLCKVRGSTCLAPARLPRADGRYHPDLYAAHKQKTA